MTLGEIGFVIRKKDGDFVMAGMERAVYKYGRKTGTVRGCGRPWKSWAAANKANARKVRREVDGKRVTIVEPLGEVMMVRLDVVH